MLKNLMKALQLSNEQIAGYMADTGPGSFTGVKVGVTLAKTLAFASNSLVAGATSFDLIDKEQPVAIQIRRGYHLVRYPNGPVVSVTKPSQEIRPGYGEFHSSPSYPHAKNFESLFNQLSWVRPEVFVPSYMAEPNISQPKKPYKSKVEP
jgi:tRNA A37 threonylcarbamoyladenosine modification protein TsaB